MYTFAQSGMRFFCVVNRDACKYSKPEEQRWRRQDTNRRDFLKLGSAALAATAVSWNATSYAKVIGANDRVRVGVIGCGDRMKGALIPAFRGESQGYELRVCCRVRYLEPAA